MIVIAQQLLLLLLLLLKRSYKISAFPKRALALEISYFSSLLLALFEVIYKMDRRGHTGQGQNFEMATFGPSLIGNEVVDRLKAQLQCPLNILA